jgi:ParB-like chromosome segregation protein Spo0J
MKTESILIDDIQCGDRLRAVDAGRVSALVASIREIGLQTPVTVTSQVDENGEVIYRLVAGAHRLQAVRQTGADYIDAFIMAGDEDDAALWEIDENFARSELTDAQRADHHVRREAILKRKGLVLDQPQGGRPPKNLDKLSKYSAKAAADLCVDERTVRRDLHRGRNITPEVMAEVAGTALDKGVVLDELASTPRDSQRAKLAEITLRRTEADRLRKETEAANRSTDRVIAITEAEQFADWIMARTDLAELPTLISWLEGTKAKDVIAALRREAA